MNLRTLSRTTTALLTQELQRKVDITGTGANARVNINPSKELLAAMLAYARVAYEQRSLYQETPDLHSLEPEDLELHRQVLFTLLYYGDKNSNNLSFFAYITCINLVSEATETLRFFTDWPRPKNKASSSDSGQPGSPNVFKNLTTSSSQWSASPNIISGSSSLELKK